MVSLSLLIAAAAASILLPNGAAFTASSTISTGMNPRLHPQLHTHDRRHIAPRHEDAETSPASLDDDLHSTNNISDDNNLRESINRRDFVRASLLATNAAAMLGIPSHSKAAKGAAEYDLEYYFRDLVFGNKPEGNLPASNAPPLPPPRTLQGPLLTLLLDDELQSCIPIKELSKSTGISVQVISNQVKDFRSKVQPAFRSRYPWKTESVTDEYFFDCTAYSLWKVASTLIAQDYVKRDVLVRNIGRRILDELIGREILSKESSAILDKGSGGNGGPTLTETIPCIDEILNTFQSSKFCSSYRLGDKNDESRTGSRVFDELDDREILDGGSVNCLVSVFNPSTLGGALQITGEGSRFAPDYVGPTLAAVWERVGSGAKNSRVEVSFESYFVDPVYRPNPKDFFPDERLYQFTIASKR